MSKEAHPNIHAVGITVDIIQSIENRLRDKGEKYQKEIMADEKTKGEIMNFVTNISWISDNIVDSLEKL